MKSKRDLDVLPRTHDALELHITRAIYQTTIRLYADHEMMDLENKPTEATDLSQESTD